jgi:ParB family chromosome partitioning protein
MRVFLRALVTIDPYAFDDVAEQLAANDENNEQTSEEILLSAIDGLPDDKLTVFALRLVLTAHTPIPRESEIDFLTEAEAAFAPSEPKKSANKKAKTLATHFARIAVREGQTAMDIGDKKHWEGIYELKSDAELSWH